MSCKQVCGCPVPPRVALTLRTLADGDAVNGRGSSRSYANVVAVHLRTVIVPLQGVGTFDYVILRLGTQAGDDTLSPGAEWTEPYSITVPLKKAYAGDETAVSLSCDRVIWRSDHPQDMGGPAFWTWEWRSPNGTPYSMAGGSNFFIELELHQAGPGCCN